jgi:archaellum component FlaC
MNKTTLNALKQEEENKNQIKDFYKYIKDLEAELEFFLTREPNESKYITSIKEEIENLYEKIEKLEESNEIN